MNRIIPPLLVTAVFCANLIPVRGEVGDADSFYAIRTSVNQRTNGVKLVTTASLSETDADRIEIRWSLDYAGPRPPLVILAPSLEFATNGITEVIVYAQPKGGKVYEMRIGSPAQLGKVLLPKDWFLTVEKDRTVSAVIQIGVSGIKKFFLHNWPEAFTNGGPVEFRAQVRHAPMVRGETHELDAWTGELYSNLVLLKLEK